LRKKFRIVTIKVEEQSVNKLFNVVRQLYLLKNSLLCISEEGLHSDKNLTKILIDLECILISIYNETLRLKLIPLSMIFKKLEKMTYSLARKLGKRVKVVIEGSDIYIDRKSVELLTDPLIHLIRNAIDHGIEEPEERIRKGKKPVGVVKIYARREGSMISIVIEDDGRGIDIEKIKRKAIRKQIITPEEASKLTWNDIVNILTMPGFSTKDKVTDISGRGVGMDIVKHNIEVLGGTFAISSEKDKGTRITLRIPLSSAIIKALIVQCAGVYYAIPLLAVNTIQKISSTISSDRVKPVVLSNEVVPVAETLRPKKPKYVIIVNALKNRKVGLLVDEIVGEENILIETLPPSLRRLLPKYINGVSLIGGKRIAFLVNNYELFTSCHN